MLTFATLMDFSESVLLFDLFPIFNLAFINIVKQNKVFDNF